ncbi:MAG TPA: hypothetical protein VGG75_42565 [Trebonia sp.]
MSNAKPIGPVPRLVSYQRQAGTKSLTRITSRQYRRWVHKRMQLEDDPVFGKGRPTPRQRDQVAARKGRGPQLPEVTG